MRPRSGSLYLQVIVAIALGVLLGIYWPAAAVQMKPLGDAFIRLIKMSIAPIIFCTVVGGIGGMGDLKKVGKTGGLALLYFEIVSTLALVVGLVVVNLLRPGAGMHVNPRDLDTAALAAYAGPGKLQSPADYLLNIVPASAVDAFAKGEILQVLLFAILFGFALQALGDKARRLREWVETLSATIFALVGLLMKLAPLGAFGAMAFTVGKFGANSLLALGKLVAGFYLTCLIFVFLVLGSIARLHAFSIWKFVAHIRAELLIVLATSSSESVLPRMIAKLEGLGADKAVVGLVIPTGYSFNLDGTSIYLTMAAVFVAQATHTPMSLAQQLGLLGVLLLTSKGAAGVTGSGFIVLAATLSSTGSLPVSGLALLLGVDRFMSEGRALTNTIGNGVATLVVAHWTRNLDPVKLQEGLARKIP